MMLFSSPCMLLGCSGMATSLWVFFWVREERAGFLREILFGVFGVALQLILEVHAIPA